MDKTFAQKNNCKEFNFFEHKHRYLPGNHVTDFPEGDSTSRAVTMYFRRIGLHALLSRKDEVEIAKRTDGSVARSPAQRQFMRHHDMERIR